jgi:hypothetical protein
VPYIARCFQEHRRASEPGMTVQLSWRREHDPDNAVNHGYNSAGFWIRELQNFEANAQAPFGKASKNAQRWFGTIPKTGDHHVYVSAHPTAEYTLRVTVK